MRIVSYHPSKQAAQKFARELRAEGAKGVRIGPRTSQGYPVFSMIIGKAPGNGNGHHLKFKNPLR